MAVCARSNNVIGTKYSSTASYNGRIGSLNRLTWRDGRIESLVRVYCLQVYREAHPPHSYPMSNLAAGSKKGCGDGRSGPLSLLNPL